MVAAFFYVDWLLAGCSPSRSHSDVPRMLSSPFVDHIEDKMVKNDGDYLLIILIIE